MTVRYCAAPVMPGSDFRLELRLRTEGDVVKRAATAGGLR
jgi:hypothetical protein